VKPQKRCDWGKLRREMWLNGYNADNCPPTHHMERFICTCNCTYTVKKVTYFPVPSRDVTHQTLPGREWFNKSRLRRVWLVTSRLGTEKLVTVFYSVPQYFTITYTVLYRYVCRCRSFPFCTVYNIRVFTVQVHYAYHQTFKFCHTLGRKHIFFAKLS
jgi:hypothetical protein